MEGVIINIGIEIDKGLLNLDKVQDVSPFSIKSIFHIEIPVLCGTSYVEHTETRFLDLKILKNIICTTFTKWIRLFLGENCAIFHEINKNKQIIFNINICH